MDFFFSSVAEALGLIVNPTRELLEIVALTFQVSLTALVLAAVFGVPLGTILVLKKFRMRELLVEGVNVLAGIPSVVVGLFLYLLLSHHGPFSFIDVVYTPAAMVVAQFLLAFSVITRRTRLAVARVDPSVYTGAKTLGASPHQIRRIVINEAGYGLLIAVGIAFGRVMSEVGALLVLGGNISGQTRVMTTAIAEETGRGNVALVLALGIILLATSVVTSLALHIPRKRLRYET